MRIVGYDKGVGYFDLPKQLESTERPIEDWSCSLSDVENFYNTINRDYWALGLPVLFLWAYLNGCLFIVHLIAPHLNQLWLSRVCQESWGMCNHVSWNSNSMSSTALFSSLQVRHYRNRRPLQTTRNWSRMILSYCILRPLPPRKEQASIIYGHKNDLTDIWNGVELPGVFQMVTATESKEYKRAKAAKDFIDTQARYGYFRNGSYTVGLSALAYSSYRHKSLVHTAPMDMEVKNVCPTLSWARLLYHSHYLPLEGSPGKWGGYKICKGRRCCWPDTARETYFTVRGYCWFFGCKKENNSWRLYNPLWRVAHWNLLQWSFPDHC